MPGVRCSAFIQSHRGSISGPHLQRRIIPSRFGVPSLLLEWCILMSVILDMWGTCIVEHAYFVSYGQWSCQKSGLSTTRRELAAVWSVLQVVADKLLNCRVRWFTDNLNVVCILQVV